MAAPLDQVSFMPQMATTLDGWMNPITLVRIRQTLVDSVPQDNRTTITFQGVIQPLKPEEIALKPEGQRSWKWLQIHVVSGSNDLANNDRIEYGGDTFKLMGNKDYSLNGYIEYHAVKDFS